MVYLQSTHSNQCASSWKIFRSFPCIRFVCVYCVYVEKVAEASISYHAFANIYLCLRWSMEWMCLVPYNNAKIFSLNIKLSYFRLNIVSVVVILIFLVAFFVLRSERVCICCWSVCLSYFSHNWILTWTIFSTYSCTLSSFLCKSFCWHSLHLIFSRNTQNLTPFSICCVCHNLAICVHSRYIYINIFAYFDRLIDISQITSNNESLLKA